ncbi:MAG: prolipoprotein diacylglyceryl transferase [Candidatus Hydrogenedentes bacterium]|nr:prolipoprotein diacylglyceryl transferase [Candidatus Hydrogenedentota bacterium]
MYPTLLNLGPIAIHTYGFLIAVGFLLSMHFIQRDGERIGVDAGQISNMAFWVLLLGLAGTRITHIIMYPGDYSWTNPKGWFAIWEGGLVFHGAIPPAILYAWWAIRRYKLNFWKMADLAMPYVPLAHAFGRLGCFFYGCCYGIRTDWPLGVRFPPGSPAALDHFYRYTGVHAGDWSFPVHPTQLYGVVGLLAACALLLYLRKRARAAKPNPIDGLTFPAYFILYGTGRFFIEFIRGDNNPTYGPLTAQQIFSLALVAASIVFFAILLRNKRKTATASR